MPQTKEGRAFDDSIDKKQLYDFRVGSGAVVPGLDIGIRTMKSGGERRTLPLDSAIRDCTVTLVLSTPASVRPHQVPSRARSMSSASSIAGIRRLYIPGNLSFPNGLPSGPGRPRVPPNSPLIWDVQLLLVPGLDDE